MCVLVLRCLLVRPHLPENEGGPFEHVAPPPQALALALPPQALALALPPQALTTMNGDSHQRARSNTGLWVSHVADVGRPSLMYTSMASWHTDGGGSVAWCHA